MPLYLTSTQTSRVAKARKPASLQRSSSLPFASSKRTKTLQRAKTIAEALDDDDGDDPALAGPGKIITVLEVTTVRDILSAMTHTRSSMFDELPERAGMNSVGIAEVLNFQKNLPAVVTLAHIHALRPASSKTERDIEQQLSSNQVRRLKLVGRGNDISGLSELLISTDEYEKSMNRSGLPEEVIAAFSAALKANPKAYALPTSSLNRVHLDALTRCGFLVSPSIRTSSASSSRTSQSVIAPAALSRSTTGTQAAVGGEAAFEVLGGVNGPRRSTSGTDLFMHTDTEYVLSVPGLAAYLQLLQAARTHLLDLLRQFSRHRQAPLYLLKERWNGNVDDDDNAVSVARRVRGEFSTVSPAKTKKWKALHGLSFDWIKEECLGAGLIELFETYSVGLGVRALG